MQIYWVLLVAVIIISLQGFIYKKWSLSKLEYKRYFNVDRCYVGDEVVMVERIVNNKMIPLPWLRLESSISAKLKFTRQANLSINAGDLLQNHKSLFSMMPFTKITRKHPLQPLKRGLYQLQTVGMTSGDFFGFQSTSQRIAVESTLLVYPRPLPISEVPFPSHSWQGDLTVKRWIVDDPFMVSGVREYRYGEPLKAVNWKATARSGKLQVHNRDFTSDHRLIILLNVEINEHMWNAVRDPELVEEGITFCASIAHYAESQGVPVGICSNSHTSDEPLKPIYMEPGSGNAHLVGIYETLAKLVIERDLTFHELLEQEISRVQSGNDYVILTPYISEKAQLKIDELKRIGNGVEVIELSRTSLRKESEAS